jgi:hypothetical protein
MYPHAFVVCVDVGEDVTFLCREAGACSVGRFILERVSLEQAAKRTLWPRHAFP